MSLRRLPAWFVLPECSGRYELPANFQSEVV